MNLIEIKKFYKESKNFLKNNQNPEILAIPNLNPNFPRYIFQKKKKISFQFFLKIICFFLRFFNFKNNFNSFLNKDYKYIILSHFVSYEHLNYFNDFYFGNLAEKLGKDNVLLVLIDHTGFDKNKIKKKINGNYIILSKTLGPIVEFKLFLKTFVTIFFKNLFNTNLNIFSVRNVIGSVDNQRISIQLKKIIKKFNINYLIFTLEGNSFEKLVCNETKKIDNNIKRIGYQFTILRKLQHSIYISINENFLPDIVYTVGEYNKKKLESKFKNKLKIFNVGLLKKNNINITKKITNIKNKKKINILVMPEGITSEIETLLNYCLFNQNKKIIYNFRLHPIFRKNKKINNLINQKKTNIKISKNKLNIDFKKNDFILYRGTAAVIDAVKHGLTPIYVSLKDEVTVDPFLF